MCRKQKTRRTCIQLRDMNEGAGGCWRSGGAGRREDKGGEIEKIVIALSVKNTLKKENKYRYQTATTYT